MNDDRSLTDCITEVSIDDDDDDDFRYEEVKVESDDEDMEAIEGEVSENSPAEGTDGASEPTTNEEN